MSHNAANAYFNSWVHIGPWQNYAKHPLSRLTFTTTQAAGGILTSVLTIYITVVGAFCWCLLCFILHQLRSTRKDQDGHFHQTQAILRNSAQDINSVKQFFQLGYAWHKKAEKNSWRVVRLCLIAFVHLAIFQLAALTSSRIYSTNSEVLIRSDLCRKFPDTNNTLGDTVVDLEYLQARTQTRWALNYARSCYGPDEFYGVHEKSAQCKMMAQPSLQKWEIIDTNADCPFPDSSLCLAPAVQIDSHVIDTNNDLGLNSHKHSRIGYRKVLTCAPLTQDGRTSPRQSDTSQGELEGDIYQQYFYGPLINSNGEVVQKSTFERSHDGGILTLTPYQLSAVKAIAGNQSQSTFSPDEGLQRSDADVTLLGASMDSLFQQPVFDLFYNFTNELDEGYYNSTQAISIMGCAEQHQLCKGVTPLGQGVECTDLTGYSEAGNQFELDETSEQFQVALWTYFRFAESAILYNLADFLSGDALLASLYVHDGHSVLSAQIPDNQWQREVIQWHHVSMARMQKTVVDVAAGPQLDQTFGYTVQDIEALTEPWDASDLGPFDICNNVKVSDPTYYNWNILGFVAIVGVGLLIILVSLLAEPLTSCIQRRTGRGEHKRQDWIEDHVVHLQRHAFEKSVGHVGWTGHEKTVPTTERRERFSSLARHSLVRSPTASYVGSPKSSSHGAFVSVQPAGSPGVSPAERDSIQGMGYFRQASPPTFPPPPGHNPA